MDHLSENRGSLIEGLWNHDSLRTVELQVVSTWITAMATSISEERWMTIDNKPAAYRCSLKGTGIPVTQEWDRRVLTSVTHLSTQYLSRQNCQIETLGWNSIEVEMDAYELCDLLGIMCDRDGLERVEQSMSNIGRTEVIRNLTIGTDQDHAGRIPVPVGTLYYGNRQGPRIPRDAFWRRRSYQSATCYNFIHQSRGYQTREPSGIPRGPIRLTWGSQMGSVLSAISAMSGNPCPT